MAIWRSSTEEMIRDRKRRQLIGGEDRRDSKKQVMAIWAVICFLAVLAVVAVKKHNDGSLTIWSAKKGSNLSLAGSSVSSRAMTPEEVSERVCRSIVRVLAYQQGAAAPISGSGVVVDGNTVATSVVVAPAGSQIVVEKNGSTFPAMYLACEPSCGMVLLHVPNLKAPIVNMSMASSQHPNESAVTVSALDGTKTVYSTGTITAIQQVDGIATMHLTNLGKNGMPGSGLFNNRGFLLGMVLSRNAKQNTGLALSADAIIDAMANILEAHQSPQKQQQAPTSASLFAPKPPPAPSGGTEVDEQLKALVASIDRNREEIARTDVDLGVTDNEIKYWKKEVDERHRIATDLGKSGDHEGMMRAGQHTREAEQAQARAWQHQNKLQHKKTELISQNAKTVIAYNQIATKFNRPLIR